MIRAAARNRRPWPRRRAWHVGSVFPAETVGSGPRGRRAAGSGAFEAGDGVGQVGQIRHHGVGPLSAERLEGGGGHLHGAGPQRAPRARRAPGRRRRGRPRPAGRRAPAASSRRSRERACGCRPRRKTSGARSCRGARTGPAADAAWCRACAWCWRAAASVIPRPQPLEGAQGAVVDRRRQHQDRPRVGVEQRRHDVGRHAVGQRGIERGQDRANVLDDGHVTVLGPHPSEPRGRVVVGAVERAGDGPDAMPARIDSKSAMRRLL